MGVSLTNQRETRLRRLVLASKRRLSAILSAPMSNTMDSYI